MLGDAGEVREVDGVAVGVLEGGWEGEGVEGFVGGEGGVWWEGAGAGSGGEEGEEEEREEG